MMAGGTEDKEHAMSQKLDASPAVIGIDIGKNSFHIVAQNRRGPESGRQSHAPACPLWGQKRKIYLHFEPLYSITLSADVSRVDGTVSPSALAALRLMTSSKLVGCWIGRSAGFVPLRTFPT